MVAGVRRRTWIDRWEEGNESKRMRCGGNGRQKGGAVAMVTCTACTGQPQC